MPRAGEDDRAFPDRLEPTLVRLAIRRPFQVDQLRPGMQDQARFHFSSMIVAMFKDAVVMLMADGKPVAQEQMDLRLAVKLAEVGFEIVAAVTVEDQALPHAAAFQALQQIAQNGEQRRGHQVHRKWERLLVRLRAERDGWKTDDTRSPLVGFPADRFAEQVRLDRIGAVRQVVIVWLGGTERQHDYLWYVPASFLIRQFFQ